MKKLVEACVADAKVIDLCIEGDKLIEEGTGAVYNKAVKGVKVTKGEGVVVWRYLTVCSCTNAESCGVFDDKASRSRRAYP